MNLNKLFFLFLRTLKIVLSFVHFNTKCISIFALKTLRTSTTWVYSFPNGKNWGIVCFTQIADACTRIIIPCLCFRTFSWKPTIS